MSTDLIIHFFEFITLAWIFCVGASLGSFLNVVVYRIPLGLNLSYPPSRCPYCETPILLKDNIPIWGWIKLRGRCRQCDTGINFRYPLIEFLTASLFIYVIYIETISGGRNLPIREPNHFSGVRWTIWQTQWDLILLYIYHMLMFYILFGSALMNFDQQRIPLRRWIIPAFFTGLIAPSFFPYLHPVPMNDPISTLMKNWNFSISENITFSTAPLFTSLTGAVCGILAGQMISFLQKDIEKECSTDYPIFFLLTGTFLGWQSVLSVALIQIILEFVVRIFLGFLIPVFSRFPGSLLFLVSTILHFTFWKRLSNLNWWPSYHYTIGKTALALAVISITFYGIQLILSNRRKVDDKENAF